MNIRLITIITLCIVFESVLITYPATLFAIILVSIFIEKDVAFGAFISGIILDLLSLRLLGLSSLYFLFLLYLGSRYLKKIHGGAFIYRFLYFLFSYVIYSLIFYKDLNITGVLITASLIVFTLISFERLFPNLGNKRRLAI